jgi:hypothetical protein
MFSKKGFTGVSKYKKRGESQTENGQEEDPTQS